MSSDAELQSAEVVTLATLALETGKSNVQKLSEFKLSNFPQLSSEPRIFMLFAMWCSSKCSSGEWQSFCVFQLGNCSTVRSEAECFGLGTSLVYLLDLKLFTLNHVSTSFHGLGLEYSPICNYKPFDTLLE